MESATQFESAALWAVLGVAVLGILYAVMLVRQILKEDQGTSKMQEIAKSIRDGANTYLSRQFRTIILLVVVLTIALYMSVSLVESGETRVAVGRAAAFLLGALFSGTVGYVGMNMATQGNVRVAAGASRGFADALRIGYRSGTITGMLTDGLGLLGGTVIFMLFPKNPEQVLLGFGFGGTLLALFMRVGGGIFTKAADVGADLVGKVEQSIPEDDPRNAAVIADLVGDNVGDCAGMAADIFESYEVTIVSAIILGMAVSKLSGVPHVWVLFPLLVRAIGVISSIIGTYAVTGGKDNDAMKAIHKGFNISAVISVVGFWLVAHFYVHDLRVFWATATGVALAVTINVITDYFTGTDHAPVKEIAKSTSGGPATVILSGLAIGFESSVWATVITAAAIFASVVIFAGSNPTWILYGVALTGIGMLTLTGNNVSMDAFGPISDNANGIGEMAGMKGDARKIMADLDAVGNTTKAITKGIAIGSAVIAAVALFGSFVSVTGLKGIDIVNPKVFIGMLIGGSVPFLFSSLCIRAVGRAANLIVEECRRQFKIPGLMEGKVKPEYTKAVEICTNAAQKELLGLGLIAVLTPMLVGFVLKVEALGGFLAGVIVVGQLLAVAQSNAGGAWDNAKKVIEDGFHGGKGSDAHKAAVVGDTVGDPLKDTAGPALNPMIKVINLVSVLIAPVVVAQDKFSPGLIVAILVMVGLVAWSIIRSKGDAYTMVK